MLTLRCGAQNYEWGKDAASSEVEQLARENAATSQLAAWGLAVHMQCRHAQSNCCSSACLTLPVQVAQLARANGARIDESKPFAELW